MTISKAQLALAQQIARADGYQQGLEAGRQQVVRERKAMQAEVFIKLVNACGQAMNVQSSMLGSLAAVLDEARGLS